MTGVEPVTGTSSWTTRIALLHPAWWLLATLLTFLGQFAAVGVTPPDMILAGVCVLGAMWFVLGWTYSIYRVARDVSAKNSFERGPNRAWVFGLAAVAILVLPMSLVDLPPVLDGLRNLVGGVGALSFFCSYWLAATALVTAEGHPVKYPTNRAVGAFLLIVYAVIGAWFIRPRVFALLETSQSGDQVRLD